MGESLTHLPVNYIFGFIRFTPWSESLGTAESVYCGFYIERESVCVCVLGGGGLGSNVLLMLLFKVLVTNTFILSCFVFHSEGISNMLDVNMYDQMNE